MAVSCTDPGPNQARGLRQVAFPAISQRGVRYETVFLGCVLRGDHVVDAVSGRGRNEGRRKGHKRRRRSDRRPRPREDCQVMDHLDVLCNRIGPRLTGSDNLTNACEWARDRFASFGIENARIEQWGEFPVGFNRGPWFGRVIEPEPKALEFMTMAWSAGTKGVVRGKAVLAPNDKKELDEAKEKGTLAGAWVLLPRPGTAGGPGPIRPSAARFARSWRTPRWPASSRASPQRAAGDRRPAPDHLGQAADAPLGDPPAQAVRRDRRLAQGRQDRHARVRHPQLLQEGPDQALQRDRRHSRHRSCPTST